MLLQTLLLLLSTFVTSPCVAPGAAPKEWVVVGGSAFAIRLPGGLREEPVRNNEVEAGAWSGAGQRLAYEYGVRTDPLLPPSAGKEWANCEAKIGGHDARIVTARDSAGAYLVAAYWEDLGRIATGTASLTLKGTARDPEGARELLIAIWTAQF